MILNYFVKFFIKPIFQNYPLSEDDQLLHAKIQESLGKFAQEHRDIGQTEKWFRRSLRTIMDLANMDNDSSRDLEMLNLKGKTKKQKSHHTK